PYLSPDQKQKIKQMLLFKPELLTKQSELKFNKIRKNLGLSKYREFNLENDKRTGLKGDITAYRLSAKNCFGKKWFSLSDKEQKFVVEKLLKEQNENKLIKWLSVKYSLPEENAKNISYLSLPDGYGRLSEKAINKLMPYLEQGLFYTNACAKAGYTDQIPQEKYDFLPYYGEVLPKNVIGGSNEAEDKPKMGDPIAQYEKYYGKINNPTVHIALNQLRKFINELIKTYGQPDEIVIELARELKIGIKKQQEIEKQQATNKKKNLLINKELESIGVTPNYDNRMKYKIWEELNKDPIKRCCPFTGKQISITDLFSPEFEIEHILPFSRTYDNSIANKVISHKPANQYKGNRSPYEAFGNSLDGYEWDEIAVRAEGLPANKKWRFQAEAMQKVQGDEQDIIARMLNDTRYMSRVARKYLQFICEPNKVWSVPGRLTALLRDKWNVNVHSLLCEGNYEKDRTEHRHHCIDAFVVACTNRGILQKISTAANNTIKRGRLIENMPEPIYDFDKKGRAQLKNIIENMVISHKPDHKGAAQAIKNHSTSAPLHKETAYGFLADSKKNKNKIILTSRKNLSKLCDDKPKKIIRNIEKIIDDKIRTDLLALIKDKTKDEIIKIVNDYSNKANIKKIKIKEEKTKDTIIPVKDKSGRAYKWYVSGNNYCAEVYCIERKNCDGKCIDCKKRGQAVWQSEIISNYQAHQTGFVSVWRKNHPTAKLMMRLFINDMVAYEENGKTKICRVFKLNKSNATIYLRDNNIAKQDKELTGRSAKWLKERFARRIAVDILGRVKDPYRRKNRCL
ncbi:type II CRISPR RNA-guided endonuclease Cas9, partial [bacterium]|nr:type II CRISPR RNA-guided endonuclease Cas9 [bacterium]